MTKQKHIFLHNIEPAIIRYKKNMEGKEIKEGMIEELREKLNELKVMVK